jgi:hypothetical protein
LILNDLLVVKHFLDRFASIFNFRDCIHQFVKLSKFVFPVEFFELPDLPYPFKLFFFVLLELLMLKPRRVVPLVNGLFRDNFLFKKRFRRDACNMMEVNQALLCFIV